MADKPQNQRRKGAVALAEIVGRILDPVTARRGFAKAELITSWPAIVGPAYADWTVPEKIAWPRPAAGNEPAPGVLVLRVDGPRAIFVQHEVGQIIERVNAFLGYAAIGQVRIVQGAVEGPAPRGPAPVPPLAAEAERALGETLSDVADDDLRAALDRLGRGVLGSRKRDRRSQ
ncbi:MAG TPA: DciA family protein [Bauldia sp.]|nr:DciA family protein [Bauldia sp.]